MGSSIIKCMLGFPTTHSSSLTQRLEGHASTMDAAYRNSQLHWLTALSAMHDAIDAALDGDKDVAARDLQTGQTQLAASNGQLTAFGNALVELRSELFERRIADLTEPLLAREPFFATLDYDGLYRQLAGQGSALPQRCFWDETAARVRDGGARGACRLVERHLRELQSDLHAFMADTEAAGRLPLRRMADALHGSLIAVSRVMIGYTRLVTTCGYVSFLCDRAMQAYEISAAQPEEVLMAAS